MNAERILISHESLGDPDGFLKAVDYANERNVLNNSIGKNQVSSSPS